MYFISRNNTLYNYIAHTKPIRRYLFTIALCGLLLGVGYSLHYVIDEYVIIFAQEKSEWQKKYKVGKKIAANNNLLLAAIEQVDHDMRAISIDSDALKNYQMFIFDIVREAGLVINSYNVKKEKHAQWYKKELISCDVSGPLDKIMIFLHSIKNSNKMMSIAHWSLIGSGASLYTFACDIGFMSIETKKSLQP